MKSWLQSNLSWDFLQFLVWGFLFILDFRLTTLPTSKDPWLLMISRENKIVEEFLFACCNNIWSKQIKFRCLLHVQTQHNKEQSKQQKHLPSQTWKTQLVQCNFESIQRAIDTPWKIWSMFIPTEKSCSNMITLRGWIYFSSARFLCSLFYQQLIYSSLFLHKIRTTYLNISTFSLAFSMLCGKLDLRCRTKQWIHLRTSLCCEKDPSPQNKTSLDWKKKGTRCYYPLLWLFLIVCLFVGVNQLDVLDVIQRFLLQQV